MPAGQQILATHRWGGEIARRAGVQKRGQHSRADLFQLQRTVRWQWRSVLSHVLERIVVDARHAFPRAFHWRNGNQQTQRGRLFHQVTEFVHISSGHAEVFKLLRHTHTGKPLFHSLGGLRGFFRQPLEAGCQGRKNVRQHIGPGGVAVQNDGGQQNGKAKPVREVGADGRELLPLLRQGNCLFRLEFLPSFLDITPFFSTERRRRLK